MLTIDELGKELDRDRTNGHDCRQCSDRSRRREPEAEVALLAGVAGLFRKDSTYEIYTVLRILMEAVRVDQGENLMQYVLCWGDRARAYIERIKGFERGEVQAGLALLEALCWKGDAHGTGSYSRELAALPYDVFLETPYWKCIRAIVLERDKHECRNCKATSRLHVHHRTYEHRGDEHRHLDDLTTLCADCHAKFHDKG